MRAFMDKLPTVLAAKDEPKMRRESGAQKATMSALVEATLSHRRVKMTYHSFSSGRVKEYLISIVLSLKVCADWVLQSWVLSFGPRARVVKPAAFAERILEEIEEAREQYMPRMSFEAPRALFKSSQTGAFSFVDESRPER
jgi:predicted DNA-binding transcriptional regulator YafY